MKLEEYLSPASVKRALTILESYKGEARIVAGGTDLVPELKAGERKLKCLVDITGIKALQKIEEDGENIKLGACVTHRQAASSKLIREKANLLAEAASAVGSPLIRNQGTVAGNVINAQPAADTAVALFALDARVQVNNNSSTRLVPIADMYQGIGKCRVDSTSELVTAIYFRALNSNQGSAFVRLAQRKALALPMLNVAVVVTVADGRFTDARIVIAPVAPAPFRSRKAEAVLKGAPVSRETMLRAAEAAQAEAQPRDSALRGSAEYRKEMVKVLVRRALEQAVKRV
ncbi:MAG: FAD binding domain-containing protein [Dehalococcoidia bacterium]|nr:FAD binding domain-containing protein [Dehalococcoidia bacterium]